MLERLASTVTETVAWNFTKTELTYDLLKNITNEYNETTIGQLVLNQYSVILEDVTPMSWMQTSILSFINTKDHIYKNRMAYYIINTKWKDVLYQGTIAVDLPQFLIEMLPKNDQKSFSDTVITSKNFQVLIFGMELFLELSSAGLDVAGNIGNMFTTSNLPWDMHPKELSYKAYTKIIDNEFGATMTNPDIRKHQTFARLKRVSAEVHIKKGIYGYKNAS